MKRTVSVILALILLLSFTAGAPKNNIGFNDVPKGHYFEEAINRLQALDITSGIGNGAFGFDKEITRAEFLAFLMRLQKFELDQTPNAEMFLDVKSSDWFYPYINMGLKNKTIIKGEYLSNSFEPNKPMTREEMAVMIVRAMKYDYLAAAINQQPSQFKDVKQKTGYIELAKDLGIISGRSKDIFDPTAKATKQEAAAMLVRMYDKSTYQLKTLNSFYAIRSFDQINKMNIFDSISYGWGRLDYNENTKQIELSTQKKNGGHPFYVPQDYQLALDNRNTGNAGKYLMIFGSNEDMIEVDGKKERLVSLLLNNQSASDKLVSDLDILLSSFNIDNEAVEFEGVVIDFEGLRDNGVDKQKFVEMLTKLRGILDARNKKLMVCINPAREAGQPYYNGYDFAAIGKLADYVILMAHDYDTKFITEQEMKIFKGETPLSPIKDVYFAMKYALNGGAGIPKDKLLLQISFSSSQWQFKEQSALNNKPYAPEYSKIISRMKDTNTAEKSMNYSETYQAPYLTFDIEGVRNIIWYEDERSVAAKAELARLLGVQGLSFWRLGTIPDFSAVEDDAYYLDVWSTINGMSN